MRFRHGDREAVVEPFSMEVEFSFFHFLGRNFVTHHTMGFKPFFISDVFPFVAGSDDGGWVPDGNAYFISRENRSRKLREVLLSLFIP